MNDKDDLIHESQTFNSGCGVHMNETTIVIKVRVQKEIGIDQQLVVETQPHLMIILMIFYLNSQPSIVYIGENQYDE